MCAGTGVEVGAEDRVAVAITCGGIGDEELAVSAANAAVLNPGTGVSGAQALANKMIKSRKPGRFISDDSAVSRNLLVILDCADVQRNDEAHWLLSAQWREGVSHLR